MKLQNAYGSKAFVKKLPRGAEKNRNLARFIFWIVTLSMILILGSAIQTNAAYADYGHAEIGNGKISTGDTFKVGFEVSNSDWSPMYIQAYNRFSASEECTDMTYTAWASVLECAYLETCNYSMDAVEFPDGYPYFCELYYEYGPETYGGDYSNILAHGSAVGPNKSIFYQSDDTTNMTINNPTQDLYNGLILFFIPFFGLLFFFKKGGD